MFKFRGVGCELILYVSGWFRDGARQQHSDAHLQPGAASARELLLPGEELRMSLPLPPGQLLWLSGQSLVIFSTDASVFTGVFTLSQHVNF